MRTDSRRIRPNADAARTPRRAGIRRPTDFFQSERAGRFAGGGRSRAALLALVYWRVRPHLRPSFRLADGTVRAPADQQPALAVDRSDGPARCRANAICALAAGIAPLP